MSKSNLLPSFSESGSEIESKFVQLNRYTVNTIHFLSQTVKFSLVHFLRVHLSISFLILKSESGSSLGPTWSVIVTFLPKNESGGARFCLPPCLSRSTAVPLRKWEWRFAKSICLFRFPSEKVKFKVHFVWLDPSPRLLPSEESSCAISGQVLGGWAGSTDTKLGRRLCLNI